VVNTDLPATTFRGRRSAAAFRVAARRVLERDGFAEARIADIAAEATRLSGPTAAWFDDGDHTAVVVAEHLRSALSHAVASPEGIPACWWDACAGGPEAVRALVDFGGEHWEEVRDDLHRLISEVVADPGTADALTEAVVHATLRWQVTDPSPGRSGAVEILRMLIGEV